MSRFTEATYEDTGRLTRRGRPVMRLTSPLVYELGYLGSGWSIRASEGTETDLASVPAAIVRTGWGRKLADEIARSAIIHDCMRADRRFSKLLGDYAFFEAMGVDGVPLHKRLICLAAVLLNFNRG